jgi:hypothetical protein
MSIPDPKLRLVSERPVFSELDVRSISVFDHLEQAPVFIHCRQVDLAALTQRDA